MINPNEAEYKEIIWCHDAAMFFAKKTVDGSGDELERAYYKTAYYALAEKGHSLRHPSPVWTVCSDGLPIEDGFYMATIRIDNVLQHGSYESRVEFDRGDWCGMSSDMKVIAWREESPYIPDHFRDATKMIAEGDT